MGVVGFARRFGSAYSQQQRSKSTISSKAFGCSGYGVRTLATTRSGSAAAAMDGAGTWRRRSRVTNYGDVSGVDKNLHALSWERWMTKTAASRTLVTTHVQSVRSNTKAGVLQSSSARSFSSSTHEPVLQTVGERACFNDAAAAFQTSSKFLAPFLSDKLRLREEEAAAVDLVAHQSRETSDGHGSTGSDVPAARERITNLAIMEKACATNREYAESGRVWRERCDLNVGQRLSQKTEVMRMRRATRDVAVSRSVFDQGRSIRCFHSDPQNPQEWTSLGRAAQPIGCIGFPKDPQLCEPTSCGVTGRSTGQSTATIQASSSAKAKSGDSTKAGTSPFVKSKTTHVSVGKGGASSAKDVATGNARKHVKEAAEESEEEVPSPVRASSSDSPTVASYWMTQSPQLKRPDGTPWPWREFSPDDAYYRRELTHEELVKHHKPENFGDKFAYYLVKTMRIPTDIFFRKKYGCRAMMLETVAAVPGMVGGMLLHLQSLRRFEHSGGWIRALLEEAENERMHLMTFMEVAQPRWWERGLVLITQGVFANAFFLLYVISPRVAHRVVGYLEEEAIISYTGYLEAIDSGKIENVPAPQIAIDYWKLPKDAMLRDVVVAVRADEAEHRDVNHLASDIKKQGKQLNEMPPPVHFR